MTVYTVTTAAEFNTAIGSAVAGDSIEIATSTALDNISISNKNFGAGITITSASGYSASFDILTVSDSSGITFENVTFKRTTGTNDWQDAAQFTDCVNITIDNCKVTSTADNNATNNFDGLSFVRGSGLTVSDTEFDQVHTGAGFRDAEGIIVSGNTVRYATGDGFVFNTVTDVQIVGNFASDFIVSPPHHHDFIQFFTNGSSSDSEDVEIRANVLLSPEANIQGIFIDSDHGFVFRNFTITENVIVTKSTHGIVLKPGRDSEISNNTIIGVGEDSAGTIQVFHDGDYPTVVSDNVVITDNITSNVIVDPASTNISETGNVEGVQDANPNLPLYVGDLFVDPFGAAIIDDLRPLPGATAITGVGATEPYGAPPVAYIEHSFGGGATDALTPTFDAVDWDASVPGGTTYSWDFGDGVTAEGPSVSHRFAAPGEHTVSLTIYTPGSGSLTVDKTIVVQHPVLLDLRFDNDPAASAATTEVSDDSNYDHNAVWSPNDSADIYITGQAGGLAAEFNGVGNHIQVPNAPQFNGLTQLTIAVDVNVDTATTARIIQKPQVFGLDVLSSGKLKAYVWTENGLSEVTTSSAVSTDVWHTVVASFDGSGTGTLSIYVDGALAATPATNVGTQLGTSSNPVRIASGVSNGYLDGAVDNVRLIEGAHSPTSLATLDAYLANPAPTDIALSGDGLYERAIAGTVVGALSTTDGGDTATYTLAPGSSPYFAISGSNLVVAGGSSLDYETATSHQVIVRATDSVGNVRQETITVTVKDAIEFPATGGGTLSGTSGSDMVYGGAGSDRFLAGAGADTFHGGGNSDTADYSGGTSGIGIDLVTPSAGSGDGEGDVFVDVFHILATNYNDTLYGDAAANRLSGDSGHDLLDGRGGNDLVYGGGGNDTLTGGQGTDTLQGSGGNDMFVFTLGEANGDRVTDFAGNGASAGDTLMFVGYGAGATLSNVGDQWTITHAGGSETFTLAGVTSLDTSDYLFT